jgi:uncharacterized membrane protein YfcA
MAWSLILPTLLILFAAALIKSTLGFGEALLAMPLLTFLLGAQTATPLVGLVGASLTLLLLLGQGWQQIEFQAAWRLIVTAAVGIPLGVWGLVALPAAWVKGGLGGVLIFVGLYNLLRPTVEAQIGARWAYLFGFMSGILTGAYNTGGPPLVLYGMLRRWPAAQFKATLQGCFLPLSFLALATHSLAGLWTPWVVQLYVICLPVVLLALWVGQRFTRRLVGPQFERLMYGGLVVLGVMLIVR